MALTIVNEQYPPRKPKLTLTADSLDELPTEGVAEGSTATVGGTEYNYDSNAGWIEPGSGGGGGSGGGVFWVTFTGDDDTLVSDKTAEEIFNAAMAGQYVRGKHVNEHDIRYLELHRTAHGSGYTANFTYTAYDATQGESGYGYGVEYLIAPPLDHITVGSWTWKVEDDS